MKTRSLVSYWQDEYSVKVKRTKSRLARDRTRPMVTHFYNFIIEKVLNGEEVFIPKIGTLSIKGKKVNYSDIPKGAINWVATKEMWKQYPETKPQMVYYLNEHTNGYYYGLKWKRTNTASLIGAFRFNATKHFRQKLHKKITDGQTEYLHT